MDLVFEFPSRRWELGRHAGKFGNLETFIHSCGNYVSVEGILRAIRKVSIENFV
jgi:hypothetical protein